MLNGTDITNDVYVIPREGVERIGKFIADVFIGYVKACDPERGS